MMPTVPGLLGTGAMVNVLPFEYARERAGIPHFSYEQVEA
jgi:hypothetical protein